MNTAPEKDEYSRIGDLLEHYSSRAVAHASFFIASIFGIVTLSAIIQQLSGSMFLFLSMLLFFGFSYVGYFTMARFGYYADLAERLASWGLNQQEIMRKIPQDHESTKNLRDYFDSQTERQKQYLLVRRILLVRPWSDVFLVFGYWLGVFLLGLITYAKFWDEPLVHVPFGILFVLTLLLVILPIVIARYGKRIYLFFKFWLIDFWLTEG